MCTDHSWCSLASALASINEVNLRRARLVLPGFNSRCRTCSLTNQPPKANSAFHPSGVGKWVPASAEKAKAGMVHSVNGWTRGVQDPFWERVPYLSALLEVRSRDKALYKSTFTFYLLKQQTPLSAHRLTLAYKFLNQYYFRQSVHFYTPSRLLRFVEL